MVLQFTKIDPYKDEEFQESTYVLYILDNKDMKNGHKTYPYDKVVKVHLKGEIGEGNINPTFIIDKNGRNIIKTNEITIGSYYTLCVIGNTEEIFDFLLEQYDITMFDMKILKEVSCFDHNCSLVIVYNKEFDKICFIHLQFDESKRCKFEIF